VLGEREEGGEGGGRRKAESWKRQFESTSPARRMF
jgi:hypothetical protein